MESNSTVTVTLQIQPQHLGRLGEFLIELGAEGKAGIVQCKGTASSHGGRCGNTTANMRGDESNLLVQTGFCHLHQQQRRKSK